MVTPSTTSAQKKTFTAKNGTGYWFKIESVTGEYNIKITSDEKVTVELYNKNTKAKNLQKTYTDKTSLTIKLSEYKTTKYVCITPSVKTVITFSLTANKDTATDSAGGTWKAKGDSYCPTMSAASNTICTGITWYPATKVSEYYAAVDNDIYYTLLDAGIDLSGWDDRT